MVNEPAGYPGLDGLVGEREVPASFVVYNFQGKTYADNMLGGGNDIIPSTDAGQVVNNAINSLGSGGRVFLKNGTYSTPTTVPMSAKVVIEGESREGTVWTYTGAGSAFTVTSIQTRIEGFTLTTSTGAVGLDLSGPFNSQIHRMHTIGSSTAGLKLRGNAGNAAIWNSFRDCVFEDPTRLAMDDVTNTANSNMFDTCRFINSCQLGNSSFNPTGNTFNNCGFNPSSGTGFVNYGNGTGLKGCDSELAGSTTTIDNENALGRLTIDSCYFSNGNSSGLEGMGITNNGNEMLILNTRASNVLYVGSTVAWRLNTTSPYFQFGEETTGSTTCTLGTNSPSTATTPSSWIKVKRSGGQTGYIPVYT